MGVDSRATADDVGLDAKIQPRPRNSGSYNVGSNSGSYNVGGMDSTNAILSSKSVCVSASTSLGRRPPRVALRARVQNLCCFIVENRFVVFITTILTVWVLISEDLKMLTTTKSADEAFGWIGVICIAIFGLEILFSCIGKEDYFLGFFFLLDFISTASLVLDLPWIMEMMQEGEGDSDVDAERGRAARIGARSARVVRVIRLVRIAKLYKAVFELSGRRRLAKYKNKLEEEDEDERGGSESRVGKKLSDITTRRVIVLVLSMLIILPYFSADSSWKLQTSAEYGADEVWLAFRRFRQLSQSGSAAQASMARDSYETTLLRYTFFHNWFAGNSKCPVDDEGTRGLCPAMMSSHLFWIGVEGPVSPELTLVADEARLSKSAVDQWAQEVKSQDAIYRYGSMPDSALDILASEWYDCTAAESSQQRLGLSLLKDTLSGWIDVAAPCYHDLRHAERTRFVPRSPSSEEHKDFHFAFWFDNRPFVKLEAGLSIATTSFICVVLCMSAMLFYNDVNQLVLYPVEEMISKVMAIRKDPLLALKMSEQMFAKEVKVRFVSNAGEQKVKPTLSFLLQERMAQAKRILACASSKGDEPMETVILEKTIVKLGSLLALGFGEAGAQIIAQNMKGTSSGVNVMIPGRNVDIVVGHCRIQNFSVVTEVLQSRVMTFVNQVAEIVHGVVEENLGSSNRNNGDTFLLIWRIPECGSDDEKERGVTGTFLADMSLLTFAKIIGAIHRSPTLASYRGHPGLQNKLGSKYRVHLTCGLHCGWAIEGAVGSEYKIEASYLSPHVSVTMNIEDATNSYGVCFLATQAVVRLATDEMRRKCRLIDNVLVPGSSRPLELYSLDLDWSAVEVEEAPLEMQAFGAKLRMRARQFLEAEKRMKPQHNVRALFENDLTIHTMRQTITIDFLEVFRMGYQNYAEGEWQVARRFLEEAHAMRGTSGDGPCAALIRFMESPHQFEAPDGWKGIHDLNPKVDLQRGFQNFNKHASINVVV